MNQDETVKFLEKLLKFEGWTLYQMATISNLIMITEVIGDIPEGMFDNPKHLRQFITMKLNHARADIMSRLCDQSEGGN